MGVVDIDAMIAARKGAQQTDTTQTVDKPEGTPPADAVGDGDQGQTDQQTPPADTTAGNPDQPVNQNVDQQDSDSQSADQDQYQDDEPEEINLDEILVSLDGQDRNVSEVIKERNEYAQRLAQIEKDDFLKGFIEHYLATGDAEAYLEAKAVDWDKKDDISVLRSKFEAHNRDLDPKIVEKLWKRELADKYKVKADLTDEERESEDYEIAQGLLKRDAKNARDEFKSTQQKFQIPAKKSEPVEQKPQFDAEAYKRQVLADKNVDDFAKTKILKIGVSDEAGTTFGYEVEDSDSVIEMMTDDRKFWNTFITDGKVDRHKMAKVYAYSMDPENFEQALVDFGKTLAVEERLKEVKNTDGRLNQQSVEGSQQGSWAERFAKAALAQKKQFQ